MPGVSAPPSKAEPEREFTKARAIPTIVPAPVPGTRPVQRYDLVRLGPPGLHALPDAPCPCPHTRWTEEAAARVRGWPGRQHKERLARAPENRGDFSTGNLPIQTGLRCCCHGLSLQ